MSAIKPQQPSEALPGSVPDPQPDSGATIAPQKPGRLYRLPAVEERTGFKKSSVYAGVKDGTFPRPVRLSARAVAWREEDIDKWVSERIKTGGAA